MCIPMGRCATLTRGNKCGTLASQPTKMSSDNSLAGVVTKERVMHSHQQVEDPSGALGHRADT